MTDIGTPAPPPGAGGTAKPNPYGLGNNGARPINVGGLFPGHKVTNANGAMSVFTHLQSPDEIAQIQQWLLQGGFYSATYVPVLGVLRPQDIAAFRAAVTVASQTGGALDQYLQEAARKGSYYGTGGGKQQAETLTHVLHQTADVDLHAAAIKGFQAAIGRGPNADELQRFTAAFHGLELSPQQAQAAAEDKARQAWIDANTGVGGGPPPLIEDTGPLPSGATTAPTAQKRAFDAANPDVKRSADTRQAAASGGAPTGDVQKIMAGIRSTESSGDYTARNPGSSASGAYGITDGTWGKYKGFLHAADAPKAIQDERAAQLIRGKLATYGGDVRKVVQSWYYPAGVGKDNYVPKGNTLTMGQYADRVLGSITGQPVASVGRLPVSQTLSVTDAPNAENEAYFRAKQEHPQEAATQGYLGRYNQFMELLKSG